jgi:hypothetical protein
MENKTYFIKYRQWNGESWGDWQNCYTYSNPFDIFAAPRWQVRVLWDK